MSRPALDAMLRAKRDPIFPREWADGHLHRTERGFCTSCGGRVFFHYALIPRPRNTPIYDRLIRGLTT